MLSIMTIRYPRHIGIKHTISITLTENLSLEQWIIPAGVTVKTYQSENFGYVILPAGCKDTRGFTVPKTIFRY
jgi:hypothetical protein